MKTLGLVMIVKNEERCLAKCLDAVKDLVDKIYITDTGSTDKTKEIAASYGAILSDYGTRTFLLQGTFHWHSRTATGTWFWMRTNIWWKVPERIWSLSWRI